MAIPYTPDLSDGKRFFAEGIGQFKIIGYEEKISKAGNLMAVINLHIWDCNGKNGTEKDFIIANTDFGATKIKNILKAINKEEDNTLAFFDGSKYIGCSGRLKIFYYTDKKDPERGEQTKFNYIPHDAIIEEPKKEEPALVDDDIPF
jgi:hypothetical protein